MGNTSALRTALNGRPRASQGTDIRGCVFTLPFAFALSLALSFALGRGSNWVWEVGVVIKERGTVNLAERKSEAEPPIPIAFTVLEMVQ